MSSLPTHPRLHFEQLQPAVELGRELGRTGKGDGADSSKTIVERRVLTDSLAERSTLEVNDKGRDLLRQTQEVDSGVEQ